MGEYRINGVLVSADLLAPGWTSYNKRLIVSTADVTSLLREGGNALAVTLTDGWYRGRLGWEGLGGIYGSELAALAQLEVEYEDGAIFRVTSDETWRGSYGSITAAGIYDGVDYDFSLEQKGWDQPGFDDQHWVQVHKVALEMSTLTNAITTGVQRIAFLPMEVGGSVLDCHQNIAGWVRLVVRGRAGDVVTVRHAEVLEPDGGLHTRSLRSARATDTYVLADDGEQLLEPNFTFHGFRYATVTGNAEVISATAVAISSAIAQRSSFECSDVLINRLHSNVQWSQRGNFISIPSDCPQRDERLGWTGDAQAFAMTSATLFHTLSFWQSWLRDLEKDQAEDGSVASVVPNILVEDSLKVDGLSHNSMGRAGWADAATIVPWSLYESCGDTAVLRAQLNSMRRWVGYLEGRRTSTGLLPTDEFQYGDWLDPDAPGDKPWAAKVSSIFVANSFFAHSARLLSAVEKLVGDASRVDHYLELSMDVARAVWEAQGAQAITTQTGCAIALEFSIAPQESRGAVADALADLVRSHGGRISTGFLGTPLVLHALSKNGKFEEAYQMLLCRDVPSWLYQVQMGATTVWERWDALRPDGSIHPGDMASGEGDHMLSFNHYAYGAVIDWVYRNLGGISPTTIRPGYRSTLIAPHPVQGIDHAHTAVDTAYGPLSVEWTVKGTTMTLEVVIPFGVVAEVRAPASDQSLILLDSVSSTPTFSLTHGTHRISVSHPLIIARDSQTSTAKSSASPSHP